MMGRARPTFHKEVDQGGLGRLADQIRALSVVPPLAPMRDTLADALCELDSGGPTVLDERARLAIAACRRFHEAVWDAIATQRQALLADATVELESLRRLLKGAAWDAAVEEVARDRVRARFPLVSAQVVWDRLHEDPTRVAS